MRRKSLAGRGNEKLGPNVDQFSIPAISTCPGRTRLCEGLCYADRGRFLMPNVQTSLKFNVRESRKTTFVSRMVEDIHRSKTRYFRIHPSGDFYSATYVAKWRKIARSCPGVIFWVYTRSWRTSQTMRDQLQKLAEERNVFLWWSVDRETGYPEVPIPSQVRLAYFQTDDEDVPFGGVHLIFRDHALRKSIVKRVAGALVCPLEQGRKIDTDCGRCRICSDGSTSLEPSRGRKSLQLVSC